MESTISVPPVPVTSQSLAVAFAEVPDPHRAASVTYPLAAMLALALSAILANHLSVLAMAEWGARQHPEVLRILGFADGPTPCQSTLQRLFRQLDGDALAQTLTRCFAADGAPTATPPGPQGVAIDGKAQRGRLRFAGPGNLVHALSALCHDRGIVLAHEPITAGTDKAEAELTVAPTLLARLDWQDRVLTGDALFCQRAICQQVCAAGGDYLALVKANQPALFGTSSCGSIPRPPWRAHRCGTGGRPTRWRPDRAVAAKPVT